MLITKDKQRKIRPIKVPTKSTANAQFFKKQQTDYFAVSEAKNRTKANPNEEKKIKTRDSMCNELLKEGYIQSYIDMFYIANKMVPNVMVEQNYAQEKPIEYLEDLSQNDINFLNELCLNLKRAETYSGYMSNEKQKGMLEYTKLAETYELQGKNIIAAYFYNRVIQMAKSFNNKQHELIAIIGISKCYDQQKQTDMAIQILQQALTKSQNLPKSNNNKQDLMKRISKDLIDIYMKVAEQFQRNQSLQNALIYFQKCLQVARKSKQSDSQGKVCYKIGQLYYKSQNFEKSVQFQQKYLVIIQNNKNSEDGKQKKQSVIKTKTMEAHASLAKCYLKMKQIDQTQKHLNEYNQLAKQLKIQNALADSSYYLAKLYEQKGNPDKSIDYYKSYFEAAKAEKPDRKDRHLVDKGRVMFAIAKSNQNMDRYIQIFEKQSSLKDVLDWKIKKQLR